MFSINRDKIYKPVNLFARFFFSLQSLKVFVTVKNLGQLQKIISKGSLCRSLSHEKQSSICYTSRVSPVIPVILPRHSPFQALYPTCTGLIPPAFPPPQQDCSQEGAQELGHAPAHWGPPPICIPPIGRHVGRSSRASSTAVLAALWVAGGRGSAGWWTTCYRRHRFIFD